MREDAAIVLDYLPNGYASSFKKEPIVQALGPKYLSLLELVARPDVKININEYLWEGLLPHEVDQLFKNQ